MTQEKILVRCQSPVSSANSEQAAIRGITNASGANNCFLNCSVQAIWNLDPFRASFVLIDQHECSDSCIFCSLLTLAANYQFHEQGPVTPDVLRNALAKSYQSDNRFQIGFMEDAAECFEGILHNLHVSLSDSSSDSLCIAERCVSHRLFSMTLVEQDSCVCSASSEPLTFDQYIFYTSVSCITDRHNADRSLTFATLLQEATSSIKPCPASEGKKCAGPAKLEVSLLEKPDVFCVGLAWPNTQVDTLLIKTLTDCIELELDLDELFVNVAANRSNVFRLVGIMVYYGMHYFTFFFHSGVKKWLLYDDACVKEVGPDWESVKTMLVKGKYQPLVLLYVNPCPEKIVSISSGKKSALSKAYKDMKGHKEKYRLKNRLACFAPASPIETKQRRIKTDIIRQESAEGLGTSPGFSGDPHRNFLDHVVSGVEEKVTAGLSMLGLKDGDKFHKKKFINDCMKQADSQYFEAKKCLVIKEYTKALDFAVDATNFYKFILSHEDSSATQRELAQIRYHTARTKAKRITRRIPATQLTEGQLSALYHRCALCENFREDDMKYCHDCTRYCTTCSCVLELSDVEYCANCMPDYVVNADFEENLKGSGHSASDVVWYDSKNSMPSPPPYESLRRTKCLLCNRSIVTSNDICHFCVNSRYGTK